MRWEDQELNHDTEVKFPEVIFAFHSLLGLAAQCRGRFLHVDQSALDAMISDGRVTQRARGTRIDRLCLYHRLASRLGPGGDHYPVLGVVHFWEDSESLYAIAYISPKNQSVDVMVLAGEPPNNAVERIPIESGSSTPVGPDDDR